MKKTVYAIIAISTVFLANINYSQCTNGTIMCTSLTASADTLCNTGNVSITVDDGTLGAGSEWQLYTGFCGGTLVATTATNNFTNISVSSTTTFFIKADSCNNSSCISIDIVLATSSNDPTSLNVSNDTLCAAGDVDFTIIGGSLGTLANWELYANSCSGSPIATSASNTFSSIAVSSSDTYFAKANGYCNNTTCVNVDVLLASSSTDPISVTSTDTLICENNNVILTVNGGSLGTNAQWNWYDDICGGNLVSQGNTLNASPSTTTTYSVRAEGYCNNSNCEDLTIQTFPHFIELDSIRVDSVFNASDTSWYIPDTICPQTAVKLFAHYSGTFPNGYSITWYENSCGSTPIGVGDSIEVYPNTTTIYYARVIGTCGASLCQSKRIITRDGSLAPTSISTNANNFCTGGSATLSIVGGHLGTGAQWNWYKGSCGGNSIGNGASITVTPASTTMYYAQATGGSCGNTSCADLLINTHDLGVYHSPLDSTCSSSPIIMTGGYPAGGAYTGFGVTDSLFDPSIAGVGTHTITYTYNDGNNCVDSTQVDITVLQNNPDPNILTATEYEICNGNSTTIYLDTASELSQGSVWVWYEEACATGSIIDTTENQDTLWTNQAAGTYYTTNSIIMSPSTTTNYYVRAEGGLCAPSNCIGVTIDVYTLSTHLDKYESLCGEATPSFNLSGGDPSGGEYSGTGVTNNIFYPDVAGIGIHTITYTHTIGSCIATDTETITISSSPIVIQSSIEQETCSEGGLMIHAHPMFGSGYYDFFWSDGSLENPLTYAEAGNYNVLISDANDCYSLLDGITVDSALTCIEMTNTFTPNNDGVNDTWNLDFSNYSEVNLVIFNKWGSEIASFTDLVFSWDGTYNGNDLPAGTYYYIIQLTESTGSLINQSGPITIIR